MYITASEKVRKEKAAVPEIANILDLKGSSPYHAVIAFLKPR